MYEDTNLLPVLQELVDDHQPWCVTVFLPDTNGALNFLHQDTSILTGGPIYWHTKCSAAEYENQPHCPKNHVFLFKKWKQTIFPFLIQFSILPLEPVTRI